MNSLSESALETHYSNYFNNLEEAERVLAFELCKELVSFYLKLDPVPGSELVTRITHRLLKEKNEIEEVLNRLVSLDILSRDDGGYSLGHKRLISALDISELEYKFKQTQKLFYPRLRSYNDYNNTKYLIPDTDLKTITSQKDQLAKELNQEGWMYILHSALKTDKTDIFDAWYELAIEHAEKSGNPAYNVPLYILETCRHLPEPDNHQMTQLALKILGEVWGKPAIYHLSSTDNEIRVLAAGDLLSEKCSLLEERPSFVKPFVHMLLQSDILYNSIVSDSTSDDTNNQKQSKLSTDKPELEKLKGEPREKLEAAVLELIKRSTAIIAIRADRLGVKLGINEEVLKEARKDSVVANILLTVNRIPLAA